jgi:hypothetical protein
MLVFSAVGLYSSAVPERRLAAVVFDVTVWGCMAALCAYLMLAYRKKAIILGNSSVRFVGVLTSQIVRLADVTRVRWYCYGNRGRVKIVTRYRRRSIWLGEFRPEAGDYPIFSRAAASRHPRRVE